MVPTTVRTLASLAVLPQQGGHSSRRDSSVRVPLPHVQCAEDRSQAREPLGQGPVSSPGGGHCLPHSHPA